MAIGFIVLAVLVALAVLPQMWVRSVVSRHSQPRADIPGTGAELARHLLDGMKLSDVKVEETKLGDHYDPSEKAVRLLPQHYHGHSLSAVVIAAHEVGHAMQDATGFKPLAARTRVAKQAQVFQTVGVVVMLAAPVVMALTKAPQMLLMELAAGLAIMGFPILMHALTLPVEFDASFNRALPVLEQGGYLEPEDVPAARQLLRAAAFTYVAAAAASLLNIAAWLRVLRI
ncbi:MAG: zinc metallopeptidase [Hyphomicrobium sp.]